MTATEPLRPRGALLAGLALGALVCVVPVVAMLLSAFTAPDGRSGYLAGALVLGCATVLLPLLVLRSMRRSRVVVRGDSVSRVVSGRARATVRLPQAREVRVRWQANPGVMGRRPVVAVLGADAGVVAHGLLIADLEPLLDLIAVEVERRPDLLTTDPHVYAEVMAGRPFG